MLFERFILSVKIDGQSLLFISFKQKEIINPSFSFQPNKKDSVNFLKKNSIQTQKKTVMKKFILSIKGDSQSLLNISIKQKETVNFSEKKIIQT